MSGGGRCLAEHQHDRRHERVTELNIVGVEAVSTDKRYAVREEALEGRAVVDVHELRGDEPRGDPTVFHPRRGEQNKVDVQIRKAVDFNPGHFEREALEAFLVLSVHVMMADVRLIRQDDVGRGWTWTVSNDSRKIAAHKLKPGIGPHMVSCWW